MVRGVYCFVNELTKCTLVGRTVNARSIISVLTSHLFYKWLQTEEIIQADYDIVSRIILFNVSWSLRCHPSNKAIVLDAMHDVYDQRKSSIYI